VDSDHEVLNIIELLDKKLDECSSLLEDLLLELGLSAPEEDSGGTPQVPQRGVNGESEGPRKPKATESPR